MSLVSREIAKLKARLPARIALPLLVCSLSAVLLFLGFVWDVWRVADRQWFDYHLLDMESFIIGRMAKSSQDGILSAGGLPGLGSLSRTPVRYADKPFADQYRAYIEGLPFGAYTPYESQVGGQGIVLSVLDKLLPLKPQAKLRLFNALTALLSTLVLTAIVLWFFLEFGLVPALFVLASAVTSQWLVVFGRNLWWSLWAFYVPVAVVMHYLRSRGGLREGRLVALGATVLLAVLVKCLSNGYEYSTAALIMMVVPAVYYGILERAGLRRLLKVVLAMVVGSGLAVLVSLLILCFQIASVEGSFADGVNHIVYSFEKRTHGDSEYFPSKIAPSLEAPTAPVLTTYLNGTFFDAGNWVSRPEPGGRRRALAVRYSHLVIVFLIMSAILYLRGKRAAVGDGGRRHLALIAATWFSVLAPLSWFVVFKAHSQIHTRINFIAWQMPFVLFGFAVCGVAVRDLLRRPTRLSA